jgi:hypothetical protein
MEEQNKGIRVGKIHRKMEDTDLNEINSRTSYKKYYADKSISKSQQGSEEIINDNLSEKANSIHTSYKYHKKNNGNNSISSGCSCNHKNENNQYNNQYTDEESVSISENDNLICPNCINNTLIEEKQKRNDKDKEYKNSNGYFQDYNKNYEKDLIDERRRKREYNTNEAIKNLAKINADLSSKDRLIQENENSRNPFEGGNDYKYQRFQDNYNRKQKLIDDNIDKYFPNKGFEKPEIDSYYDNYVYNNKNNYINKDGGNKNGIKSDNYEKDKKKEEYIKSLEDQINYKNELKRKEREAEKKREQEQYENNQREMKKEQEEKFLKEQKQKKELLEANMELINQKNKQKMKEMEDKLKYREYYDRENEEYQKELAKKQLEKEKMRNEIYNENRSEYENKKRFKDQERQKDNNINQDKLDMDEQNKSKVKERMGRCCRCQRVFPRKMLTINRYFYKENRK